MQLLRVNLPITKKNKVMSKKKTSMTKEVASKLQSIVAKKPGSDTAKSEFAKRAQSIADKNFSFLCR